MKCPLLRAAMVLLGGLLAAVAALAQPDAPGSPAPPSLSARKVYEQARSQLVQIRTVLKGRAAHRNFKRSLGLWQAD